MNANEYKAMAAAYLAALPAAGKSPCTVKAYRNAADGFGAYLDGSGEDVSPLAVIGWRSALAAVVGNNTTAHSMTILHALFAWANRNGLAEQNPVDVMEIPKHQRPDYDLLTLDEIETLLKGNAPRGINKKTSCRNRAIVIILLQAGLRSDEVRSLTPADLDFENGAITVKHGKGDKRRTVPFPAIARAAMRDYLNSGYRPDGMNSNAVLFGTKAQNSSGAEVWAKLSSEALRQLVRVYTGKACGHSVYPHALRHAAASMWVSRGISMRDTQNALGHSSILTTERVYVSILDPRGTATKINKAFDEAAETA